MRRLIITILALALLPAAAFAQGVVPTVRVQPPPATSLIDRSGTITLGGSAQTLAPANAFRLGLCLQNLSAGDMWLNTLATAVGSQPSIWLPAGTYYCVPAPFVGAVSLYGITTGQPFYAREW